MKWAKIENIRYLYEKWDYLTGTILLYVCMKIIIIFELSKQYECKRKINRDFDKKTIKIEEKGEICV